MIYRRIILLLLLTASFGFAQSRSGLWIGVARVDQVSRPASGTNVTWDIAAPLPVAQEFPLRLIVHVDESGQAKLLQKVIMLNTTNQEDVVYLYTDESQALGHSEDEIASVTRFQTSSFPPIAPMTMGGSNFGDAGSMFSATVNLAHDATLNPFVHRYHPDHDNKDRNFVSQLPAGQESYAVQRLISLAFEGEDPYWIDDGSEWGTRRVGGTYKEEISGIHRDTIYVQGSFELHRVSEQTELEIP